MLKKILFLILMCLSGLTGYSQSEAEPKKVNQYIGLQANQLLRQLFSFSGTNPAVNNPYLISYAANSTATGWGFASGLGYRYNQFEEGDPSNPLKTTINELSLRMGVERKVLIGKKWMAGFGMDVLTENEKNKTVSNSSFDDFETETKSTTFGLGPRVTLNFNISERIILGTEASYYYKKTKQVQKVTDQEDIKEKFTDFSFVLPAVIFLYIKF